MPSDFWKNALAVFWQTTLVNAAIQTLAFWVRMPMSGYSVFQPVAALFTCAILTFAALAVGAVAGLVVSWIPGAKPMWFATGGFLLVYAVFTFPRRTPYAGSPDAGLEGFQIVLTITAAIIWYWQVLKPGFDGRPMG